MSMCMHASFSNAEGDSGACSMAALASELNFATCARFVLVVERLEIPAI